MSELGSVPSPSPLWPREGWGVSVSGGCMISSMVRLERERISLEEGGGREGCWADSMTEQKEVP